MVKAVNDPIGLLAGTPKTRQKDLKLLRDGHAVPVVREVADLVEVVEEVLDVVVRLLQDDPSIDVRIASAHSQHASAEE